MAAEHSKPEKKTLSDLPAELRNLVYTYTLVEDEPISWHQWRRCIIKEPSLLCTSRQVRNETLSMYYGDNTFSINSLDRTQRFLHQIATAKLPLFKCVRASEAKIQYSEGQFQYFRKELRIILGGIEPKGLMRESLRVCIDIHGGPSDLWVTPGQLEEYHIDRVDVGWAVVRKTQEL